MVLEGGEKAFEGRSRVDVPVFGGGCRMLEETTRR